MWLNLLSLILPANIQDMLMIQVSVLRFQLVYSKQTGNVKGIVPVQQERAAGQGSRLMKWTQTASLLSHGKRDIYFYENDVLEQADHLDITTKQLHKNRPQPTDVLLGAEHVC